MTFIWPIMLLTLLLIPLFVWGYFALLKRRAQRRPDLGGFGIVRDSSGEQLGNKRHLPPLLYGLALTLLLFGLARPELPLSVPRTEGTVILAFDVSNSMNAEDLEPTRMEAAKLAAAEFIENQPATIDVGVVAFSNGGLVVQQPSNVKLESLATIERLSVQGGTSLGQGIFTSLNAIAGDLIVLDEDALAEMEETGQVPQIGRFPASVIILLTDGEDSGGGTDPLLLAQMAAEAGVRIYTVGIGSAEGSVLDVDGFSVVTALNEPVLQDIAGLTNGEYFSAETQESLRDIYDNIDLRLTIAGQQTEITAPLALISLLLLLTGAGLSQYWLGRAP